VSHPIPLHTVERLERALQASSRYVAARGPKGWVMRIVAYFACQYARAVIELLEGLLAEYRAGTLVFPAMVDDSSTIAAQRGTEREPTVPPPHAPADPAVESPRRLASRRGRGPGAVCVQPSDGAPCEASEHGDSLAQTRAEFALSLPRRPIRYSDAAPRFIAGHPSRVPRPPGAAFGGGGMTPTHVHYVSISDYSAIHEKYARSHAPRALG
jgi:hypothetical protein